MDLFVDACGVPLWHPKRDVSEPAPQIPLEKLSWLKSELGYGDQNLRDLPKMIPFIWEVDSHYAPAACSLELHML